jgi:hypothetical protein
MPRPGWPVTLGPGARHDVPTLILIPQAEGEPYLLRARRQQQRLLVAGAALIGPYYLLGWMARVYPPAALLAGLGIAMVLLAAAWRAAGRARPRPGG